MTAPPPIPKASQPRREFIVNDGTNDTYSDSPSPEARAAFGEAYERGDLETALSVYEADLDRRRAERDSAAAAARAATSPTTGTTTRGTTVEIPAATTLATEALLEDGLTREQALERLVTDPSNTLASLADRISQKQKGIVDAASLAEDEAFAASPEGKLAAARQAAEAREQRARDAKLLREHLKELHAAEADPISRLSDDEVFQLAGVEKSADQLREEERERQAGDPKHQLRVQQDALLEKWWQLSPTQRREGCTELGMDFEKADAHVREQWDRRTSRY
jgi:hypothetical protein